MNKVVNIEGIEADNDEIEKIRTVMRFQHIMDREDFCSMDWSEEDFKKIEEQILYLVAKEKDFPPVGNKPNEQVLKIYNYLKDICFVRVNEFYYKQCRWLAEKGKEFCKKKYPKLYPNKSKLLKKRHKDKKIRSILEIVSGGDN